MQAVRLSHLQARPREGSRAVGHIAHERRGSIVPSGGGRLSARSMDVCPHILNTTSMRRRRGGEQVRHGFGMSPLLPYECAASTCNGHQGPSGLGMPCYRCYMHTFVASYSSPGLSVHYSPAWRGPILNATYVAWLATRHVTLLVLIDVIGLPLVFPELLFGLPVR
jgi:hypothetical protein